MSSEKEENDMGIYKRRDNINLTEQEYEIYLFLIKYFKKMVMRQPFEKLVKEFT